MIRDFSFKESTFYVTCGMSNIGVNVVQHRGGFSLLIHSSKFIYKRTIETCFENYLQ